MTLTVRRSGTHNNNSWITRFNYCAEGAFMSPAIIFFELGSQDLHLRVAREHTFVSQEGPNRRKVQYIYRRRIAFQGKESCHKESARGQCCG